MPQFALAVIVAVSGLGTAVLLAWIFKFDVGTAAGLLSGGMTQSAAIGTSIGAINSLPVSEELRAQWAARVPLADAITYGFGDFGLIFYLVVGGPLILRQSLKHSCAEYEKSLGASSGAGSILGVARVAFRVFKVDKRDVAGKTVGQIATLVPDVRISIQSIKRNGKIIPISDSTEVRLGDEVAVVSRREGMIAAARLLGEEVDDPDLAAVPLKTASVVVTKSETVGKTIADLAPLVPGVVLDGLYRCGEEMPRAKGVTLRRGDLLKITGTPEQIAQTAQVAGYLERDSLKTDMFYVSLCVAIGISLGMLSIPFGGVPLGLGASGSILIIGLLAGWFRSRFPVIGAMPEPAQRLMSELGLTVFIAVVGLVAGPHAVHAFHEQGAAYFISIFSAGIFVTVVPPIAATLAGKYLLGLHPVIILGGIAGSQTCTPAVSALREAGGSNVVAIGYTVPYAIGNVLLTVWGPVIVAIVYNLNY